MTAIKPITEPAAEPDVAEPPPPGAEGLHPQALASLRAPLSAHGPSCSAAVAPYSSASPNGFTPSSISKRVAPMEYLGGSARVARQGAAAPRQGGHVVGVRELKEWFPVRPCRDVRPTAELVQRRVEFVEARAVIQKQRTAELRSRVGGALFISHFRTII